MSSSLGIPLLPLVKAFHLHAATFDYMRYAWRRRRYISLPAMREMKLPVSSFMQPLRPAPQGGIGRRRWTRRRHTMRNAH